ncbi:MAG: SDR family NAD(P)-dependent oxidoreductase [Deltaproteobacteria bacterium]|nr:SDR family NAD(P)-dependent oxidoreductase [Deltaproteobacteria bacterium]MBW2362255.1 SDR family NAD(P)-dependent oxidoreductase [Deltaproteobacteria bacterium]
MSHPALAPGRVAVVTGGASGIGLAVCKRLAGRGMRVCLADVDAEKLVRAGEEVAELAAGGSDHVVTCAVDVSQRSDLERLQGEVLRTFGEVALLMNNAAAFRFGSAFRDREAWETTFAVNVMGVVHGLQVFVPKMLEQGTACLVINTGSKQGITNPPGIPNYNAAKAAVRSLTESLQHELRNIEGCQVAAHLLVPGWTTTGGREHHPSAWLPEQVADWMIAAVERGDFYILCPDGEVSPELDRKRVLWGAMDITQNRPALSRWHPDYKDEFETFEP